MDLSAYVELSERGITDQMENGEVRKREFVTGVNGAQLATIEYTGRTSGRDLHFLAICGVHEGRAVVATLTTLPADFGRLRRMAEPVLSTLQLT